MEALDAGMRLDQALDDFHVHLFVGSLAFLLKYRDTPECAVLFGHVAECAIPLVLHPRNNLRDGRTCVLQTRLPGREPRIDPDFLPHSANIS